ncbi:MAG: hypothetical protein ACR2P3_09745 [Geminicoccaceae bacterium]
MIPGRRRFERAGLSIGGCSRLVQHHSRSTGANLAMMGDANEIRVFSAGLFNQIRFGRSGFPGIRCDQIFKEIGGEGGFSWQVGFLIDRLCLLPHGRFGGAAQTRNFLVAQAFQDQHADILLGSAHPPTFELGIHFVAQALEMGFGFLSPLGAFCACDVETADQIQPFFMLVLHAVDEEGEADGRGNHQEQTQAIDENVGKFDIVGFCQDFERHQQTKRNDPNTAEHRSYLPLRQFPHHVASPFPERNDEHLPVFRRIRNHANEKGPWVKCSMTSPDSNGLTASITLSNPLKFITVQ